MRTLVALFTVLLCFSLYHQIDGLKCYDCRGDCSAPKESECVNTEHTTDWLCIDATVTVFNITLEAKGCAPNNDIHTKSCEVIEALDNGSCSTCLTDLCNGSSETVDAKMRLPENIPKWILGH